MALHRHAPERFLELGVGDRALDAEDFVVAALAHGRNAVPGNRTSSMTK
jgi:hypothetical protein